MHVADLMAKPVVTATAAESLESVARKMLDNKIGAVVVVDREGKAEGIITETDFAEKARLPYSSFNMPSVLGRYVTEDSLERIYRDARAKKCGDAMHRGVHAVEESDPVEKAADLMLRHHVKHIPVLRSGRPVGMLAHHDLLRGVYYASRKKPAAA